VSEKQSITEVLVPGWSIVKTSYGTGPYRIVHMSRHDRCLCDCFECFCGRHHGCVDIYEAWDLICVALDAMPRRDGTYSERDFNYLNGYFLADGEIRNRAGDRIILLDLVSPPPRPIQVSLFAKGA